MWLSVTGLSEEPSRAAHHAVLEARGRASRSPCWTWTTGRCSGPTPRPPREQVQRALPQVTVAVGNREECEVAVGETDPERAADALLDAGVELAIVKQGPEGVLARRRTERVVSPPIEISR